MQQEQESAKLCVNGCGFFGSPAMSDMCSVCWKKTMSNRQMCPPISRKSQECLLVSNDASLGTKEESVEEKGCMKVEQTNKKRCWECRKKVGLTALECRCGYVYCTLHRYAEQHQCTFDYKTAERAELAKRNPGGGQFGKLERL